MQAFAVFIKGLTVTGSAIETHWRVIRGRIRIYNSSF